MAYFSRYRPFQHAGRAEGGAQGANQNLKVLEHHGDQETPGLYLKDKTCHGPHVGHLGWAIAETKLWGEVGQRDTKAAGCFVGVEALAEINDSNRAE